MRSTSPDKSLRSLSGNLAGPVSGAGAEGAFATGFGAAQAHTKQTKQTKRALIEAIVPRTWLSNSTRGVLVLPCR